MEPSTPRLVQVAVAGRIEQNQERRCVPCRRSPRPYYCTYCWRQACRRRRKPAVHCAKEKRRSATGMRMSRHPPPDPSAGSARSRCCRDGQQQGHHRAATTGKAARSGRLFDRRICLRSGASAAHSGRRRTAIFSSPKAPLDGFGSASGRRANRSEQYLLPICGTVWHRLLSSGTKSAMGLCRQHRFRRSLCLSQRRSGCARACAKLSCRTYRSRPSTRDVVFSPERSDYVRLVGSGSNVGDDMGRLNGAALDWVASHPLGAAWGPETDRADVLAVRPAWQAHRRFRHRHPQLRRHGDRPVEMARSGARLTSATGIGNNLPPDYITRVREGAFYGWPWYYIGGNENPAAHRRAARPQG